MTTFITVTETAPAAAVTVAHTVTETTPPTTVTVTHTVTQTAVVAAPAPVEESSTEWGWIAFGILAAAVVVFAMVWLVRRR